MRYSNLAKRFFWVISVILLLIYPAIGYSEDYPNRAITILNSYSAGGSADITLRALAEISREILGQPVVVINKSGGAGSLAHNILAKEKPDGYTLAIASDAGFTQIPQMRDVAFDPLNDFEFIMQHWQIPGGIVCQGDSPWKTWKDLIAYSKENPNKLSYGCLGKGGGAHIGTEFIFMKEGIKWRMVPVGGNPKLTAALLGKHIDLACSTFSHWIGLIKAGELRALVVEEALKEKCPDAPTFEELGYELPIGASFGIVAPKGTPAPIIKKLHDSFKKALEDPKYQSICENNTSSPTYLSGEEFFKRIKNQYEMRGKILEKLGLKKK